LEPNRLFIGGEWVPARGDRTHPVTNPSTGKVFAEMAVAEPSDVDAAVGAARSALDDGRWAAMTGFGRRQALLRFADELRADDERIGGLNTDDVGMPLSFTVPTVGYCADYLEYFAGWADKVGGDAPAMPDGDLLDYTIRHPVGVVAAIVPWNVPVFITIAKLAPALAAGCTVVLKPSELAPLSPLAMVEAAARADLPPGVVNVVTGLGETGAALVEHPGVDMISFTGGGPTAAHIARAAAGRFARLTLELGGKSANIVFADADLGAAVDGVCQGFLINTGQQCTAGARVLVERPVYDEVVERVVEAADRYPIGMPREPTTLVGPLISQDHLDRVMGFVEEARSAGRVARAGERLGGDLADGWFLSPTVVADADLDHRLCREEIFGPVVAMAPFDTAADAVALANDSPFGLVAGVWSENVNTAHWVSRQLRTGTVWVNTYLGVLPPTPFGGHKASGIGREGGWDAVVGFTETTNVMVRIRPPGRP
jgi:aldehyde dehydrogenase (NAD+)